MRIAYAIGAFLILLAVAVPHGASAQFSKERIRGALEQFFDEAPEMVAIAECESGLRQFTAGGNVLRGGLGNQMIGLFQLHEKYHRSAAQVLGLNIETLFGNIAYAKHLFQRKGSAPWISSAPCWKPKIARAEAPRSLITLRETSADDEDDDDATSSSDAMRPSDVASTSFRVVSIDVQRTEAGPLTRRLTYTDVDEQVRIMQRLLNAAGFTIAESGPGAPGNETNIFGPLTFKSLTRFQCARDIVCLGDADMTAYGLVEERTRAALNEIATQG